MRRVTDHLQDLRHRAVARGRARAASSPARRIDLRGRLHPFLHRRAGRRDRGQAFRRRGRPGAGRGRCGRARRRAAIGALARRRTVSASLWRAAARRGAVGKAAAARRRRPARVSGACAVIGLFEALARPLLRRLDPEDAHRARASLRLKLAPLVTAGAGRSAAARCGPSGSTFPIRSAWRPASTRTPRCPTRCSRLGFGFVEVGTRDAAAAAGQSAAAPVPARRATRA